jgi:hypothetical protein
MLCPSSLSDVGILPQHYTASQPRRPRLQTCTNSPLAQIIIIIIALQGTGHSRPVPAQNFNWNLYGHLVGLLGRGISPTQGLYLHTQDNTTQKNADTHLCPERDSSPRFQCSSGRKQYLPKTARPLGPATSRISLGLGLKIENY